MMIATILLIVTFVLYLVKDIILFNFWHFLWIYPAEIIFWILIQIFVIKLFRR